MKRTASFFYGLWPYLLSTVASALTIAQAVLAIILHRPSPEALQWAGWICVWASALFGLLPILSLRRKGSVPQGKSYVHTTALVDSGIYAIVRHPQGGVAGLLISLGIMLITPHWSTIVLGVLAMALTYVDTYNEDRNCIEKFGKEYKRYMQRVPRVNFPAGAIRCMMRRMPEVEQ